MRNTNKIEKKNYVSVNTVQCCMWWKLDAVFKFCKMLNFLQNVPRQVGPLEEAVAATGGRNATRVHQETKKNWSTVQGADSCEWDLERVWSKTVIWFNIFIRFDQHLEFGENCHFLCRWTSYLMSFITYIWILTGAYLC